MKKTTEQVRKEWVQSIPEEQLNRYLSAIKPWNEVILKEMDEQFYKFYELNKEDKEN